MYIKLKKDYAEALSQKTGIRTQSQYWGENKKLSMEGIAVEYFTNSVDHGSNEKTSEFHSYISDDNEHDAYDSNANMFHLLKQ